MITELSTVEVELMDGSNFVTQGMILENGMWLLCIDEDTEEETMIPTRRIRWVSGFK